MPAAPKIPEPGTVGARLSNAFVAMLTRMYRWTGGLVGGKTKGAPVLLLDSVGRKSGKARTTPLIYFEDGPDLVLTASRGGSDAMPGWYFNLKASPSTTVQIGSERRSVVAREATPEEHERLWPGVTSIYPDYAIYQTRTIRKIPLIILSPA